MEERVTVDVSLRANILLRLEEIKIYLLDFATNQQKFIVDEDKLLNNIVKKIDDDIQEINKTNILSIWSHCLYFAINHLEGLAFRLQYKFGDSTKNHVLRIQNIIENCKQITISLKPVPESTPLISQPLQQTKEHAFFVEQCQLDANEQFRHFLTKVKNKAAKGFIPKKIFVSYAWPSGEVMHDKWTEIFVENLVKHLILAGLMVYQDKVHSGFGKHLNEFMLKTVQEVDHIFFIITETYVHKFTNDSCTGISTEYFAAIDRRRKFSDDRIICPILLTDKNLPAFARSFSGIPVYDTGYINALREIFVKIYNFGAGHDSRFNQWFKYKVESILNFSSTSSQLVFSITGQSYSQANLTSRLGLLSDMKLNTTQLQKVSNESEFQAIECCTNLIELQVPIETQALSDLENFVNELKQNKSVSNQTMIFIIISGLPGSGKTVLAQNYIGRYKKNTNLVTVCILRAETALLLRDDYESFARQLKIPIVSNMPLHLLKHNVEKELTKRQNFLLVFDNASSYESIAPYLPSPQLNGTVIITSRDNLFSYGKTFSTYHFNIADHPFSRDESLKLLTLLAKLPIDKFAECLVKVLCYLPLGLAQAGSYIARCEGTLSYEKYLNYFMQPHELWQDESYFSPSENYQRNYNIAINLTLDEIIKLAPELKLDDLVSFICLLSPDLIPEFLLQAKIKRSLNLQDQILTDMKTKTSIQLIQKGALMNRLRNNTNVLSMHRIVQSVIQVKYKNNMQTIIQDAMIILIASIDVDYRSLKNWENRKNDWNNAVTLLAHAESILQYAEQLKCPDDIWKRYIAKLLQLLAEVYSKKSQYQEVNERLEKALRICEQLNCENPENRTVYSDVLLSKGRFITWQKDAYVDCINTLQHAHKLICNLHHKDHPKALHAYGAIAVCHNFHEHQELAISMFKELLDNPHLPKDDWQEAGYNHNLVLIYFEAGNIDLAQKHMSKALEIYKKHRHPQINPVMLDLGWKYIDKFENLVKAREFFDNVIKNYEADPGFLAIRPIYVAEAYFGIARIEYKNTNLNLAHDCLIKVKKLDQDFNMNLYSHQRFKNFKNFEESIQKSLINKTNQYGLSGK